jgi:hypothetical protein
MWGSIIIAAGLISMVTIAGIKAIVKKLGWRIEEWIPHNIGDDDFLDPTYSYLETNIWHDAWYSNHNNK